MAGKNKLRAQVEDELRTLLVCPAVLDEQQKACLSGPGSQLLANLSSKPNQQAAQQHFEQAAHLQKPDIFGSKAPRNSQQYVTESFLHFLLLSNRERIPGFQQLLQQTSHASTGGKQFTAFESPLLRLLRHVALWYYYTVMFDPLDQLVALNSSCELLFQLMTPHQQLACMADILLVLACPALEHRCGQLDTPLHTATLLSMLKMAQTLALAEANLQQQEQQLVSIAQQKIPLQDRDQTKPSQQQQDLQQQEQGCMQAACAAAAVLTPPSLAILQLSRLQSQHVSGLPASRLGQQGLWPQDCKQLRAAFTERFGVLEMLAAWRDSSRMDVLGAVQTQVALQQSTTCKLAGALLSQLSQLPQQQLWLWWQAQEPEQQQAGLAVHTINVAQWLRQCCSALAADSLPDPFEARGDPVGALVQWVVAAMSGGLAMSEHQQHQEWHHQQQDLSDEQQQQQQQQDGGCPHPAEALRQLLDVLLSALLHRHAVSMEQWELQDPYKSSQASLLAALHCHCMQLLAQARDTLPTAACVLGRRSPHSCSSGSSTGDSAQQQRQQQQQRQAWRICLQHVQHDLLLVLQLTKHWQQHNRFACFEKLFKNCIREDTFLLSVLNPIPGADVAATVAALQAVQKIMDAKEKRHLKRRLAQRLAAGRTPGLADIDTLLAAFPHPQQPRVGAAPAAAAAAAAAAGPLRAGTFGTRVAAPAPVIATAANRYSSSSSNGTMSGGLAMSASVTTPQQRGGRGSGSNSSSLRSVAEDDASSEGVESLDPDLQQQQQSRGEQWWQALQQQQQQQFGNEQKRLLQQQQEGEEGHEFNSLVQKYQMMLQDFNGPSADGIDTYTHSPRLVDVGSIVCKPNL